MINYIASETASQPEASGIGALGLNWKAFLFQLITFAIIVYFLNKFVLKKLFKAIDERKAEIDAGLERSKQASDELNQAEAKAEDLLKEARSQAEDLLHSAQNDASKMLKQVEDKANVKSERIIFEAKEQLKVEVDKAKVALKKENAKLIAEVSAEIIGDKMDTAKDKALIEKALR